MNIKAVSTTVLLSALTLTGCSTAPTENPAEVTPTTSSTPTAAPKAVQRPVAPVVQAIAPEDPKAVATINELTSCSMAVFMEKLWGGIAVKPEVPAAHQARAEAYVDLVLAKKKELEC